MTYPWLAAPLIALLMACSPASAPLVPTQTEPSQTDPGTGDAAVIIPATTKVADAITRAALSAYDADTGLMRFSQQSPLLADLKPGDVLVGEPSNAAPSGYLRKVSAMHQSGADTLLDTTQANLTDAVIQGELISDFQLGGDDLLRTEGLPEGATLSVNLAQPGLLRPQAGIGENFSFNLKFNHTFVPVQGPNASGTVKVDGEVSFNVGYGVNVGIKACFELPPVCVKSFEAKVGFNQRSNLNIKGDFQGVVGGAVKVGTQYFKPKIFFIGPVPVVLVPKIELYLTAGGEIRAKVNFAASQSVTAQVGSRWTKASGWKDISGFTIGAQVSPPSFTGALSPRVGLRTTASFTLYGVAGPEATLEGGVKLDVAYPRNPNWIALGFLKGTLGFRVKLPVLGTLASYSTTLFDISKELARSVNTPPTIALTDQTRPLPGSGQALRSLDLGVPISFQPGCGVPGVFFFVVGDDQDGCNVQVSVVSDRDGPLSLRPTFASTGPRTLTVTVQDTQGAQARAAFSIDVVNAPPSIQGGIAESTVSATVPLFFSLRATDPNSGPLGCDAISVVGGSIQTISALNGDCRYSVTFAAPGSQTVTVTARDPQGGATTKIFQLLVTAPPAIPAPIWVAPGLEARGADGRLIPDGGHVKCFEQITFSVQATDPGGQPVSYTWGAAINKAPPTTLVPDADGKLRVSYTTYVLISVIASNGKALTKPLVQRVIWPPEASCPPPGPR